MKHSTVKLLPLKILQIIILLLWINIKTTNASTTHQISYDGIVASDVSNNDQIENILITPILELLVQSFRVNKDNIDNNIQTHCLDDDTNNNDGTTATTKTCFFQYKNNDDDVILSSSGMITFIEMKKDDSIAKTTLSMDISVQTKDDGLSQEILLNFYSNLIIDNNIIIVNDDISDDLWSIRSRSKLGDVGDKKEGDGDAFKGKILSDKTNKKRRLYVSTSNSLYDNNNSNDEEEDEDETNAALIEIWEYSSEKESEEASPPRTKALFLNGMLRSLTNDVAASSQAEAFIHPALLSHPLPTRVAILSQTPFLYIKEILKYKSMQVIDVIGMKEDLLYAVLEYAPEWNDCSGIDGLKDNCLENDAVHVINEDPDDWLGGMLDATPSERKVYTKENMIYAGYPDYDVIYIDVASGTLEELHWLSIPFLSKLNTLMDFEVDCSMVVIHTGTNLPSLDIATNQPITITPTEDVLFNIIRTGMKSKEIIDFDTFVFYDEPLASPLKSVFFLMFYDLQLSFNRFFRRNLLHVDLDMTRRLYPSTRPNTLPTVLYDGPTHERYKVPSRVWETYFCNTKPWDDSDICMILNRYFNISYHHFELEVRQHPVRGRTIHSLEDIPEGHFIAANDAALSLHIDEIEYNELCGFIKENPTAEYYTHLRDLFEAYGFEDYTLGKTGHSVSLASNSTFINHACRTQDISIASVLDYYRTQTNFTMASIDTSTSDNLVTTKDDQAKDITKYDTIYKFSPALQRRPDMYGITTVAARDIGKGEELLQDYKNMGDAKTDGYYEYLKELDDMCQSGVGWVPVDGDGDSKVVAVTEEK